MAKYKFENHAVELIDPVIEMVAPRYIVGDEYVSIIATLNANGNKVFGVDLGAMPNTEGWTDADVMIFANTAIKNFVVEE